jgi:hypothetical protein
MELWPMDVFRGSLLHPAVRTGGPQTLKEAEGKYSPDAYQTDSEFPPL